LYAEAHALASTAASADELFSVSLGNLANKGHHRIRNLKYAKPGFTPQNSAPFLNC